MTHLQFWKTHSVGNDFVLIRAAEAAGLDLGEAAISLCRRRFGIGADGLLVLGERGDDLDLRMFNADGTEDFCGNGLSCSAFHAWTHGLRGTAFTIWHGGQPIAARVTEGRVQVTLGRAQFNPAEVPLIGDEMFDREIEVRGRRYRASSLTTGSTHTVLLVDNLPGDEEFFPVSQALEHDERWPERTSVIWTVPEAGGARIRIWERGVGETLGCGTGSLAAGVVLMRQAGGGGLHRIAGPGGEVGVEATAWDAPLTLHTRPQEVFTGSVSVASQRIVAGV